MFLPFAKFSKFLSETVCDVVYIKLVIMPIYSLSHHRFDANTPVSHKVSTHTFPSPTLSRTLQKPYFSIDCELPICVTKVNNRLITVIHESVSTIFCTESGNVTSSISTKCHSIPSILQRLLTQALVFQQSLVDQRYQYLLATEIDQDQNGVYILS